MVTQAQRRREAKAAEQRRNRRGVLFTVLSLAGGFGSWGYFVLAADPSFYFGVALLWLCALFLTVAFIEFFRSSTLKAALTVLVVVMAAWGSIWAKDQWLQKMKMDMTAHLDVSLALPETGDAWESRIIIKNNSNSAMAGYLVDCSLKIANQFNLGEEFTSHERIGFIKEFNEGLKPGGDGQTDGCFMTTGGVQTIKGNGQMTCADMVVAVRYTLDKTPVVNGTKEARFVYGYLGTKSWTQQPVSHAGLYCPLFTPH